MKQNSMLAMILAGGRGSRLHDLTNKVAKPAVSYGGKYRIVDFPLSNCANSGVDVVGVLTQYESIQLNSYVAAGGRWGLDAKESGVYVLPPREKADENLNVYRGTADAISQNIDFIDKFDPEYVLVLSGDHIYKMNYDEMLAAHKEAKADATIAVIEVPMKEASRFGIMNTDETGRIVEFEEKPEHPKSNLASMGIYIFTWKLLRKMLMADIKNPDSNHDFGKDIIPTMLPQYISAEADVKNAYITQGCVVQGEVKHSVLFTGVKIGAGAKIIDSVLMPGAIVEEGAVVQRALVANGIRIGKDAVVGSADSEHIELVAKRVKGAE